MNWKNMWTVIKSKLSFFNRNFFISFIFILVITSIAFLSIFDENKSRIFSRNSLSITAALSAANDSIWNLKGRVFQQKTGQAMASARVWIILTGDGGHDYSPRNIYTDKYGEFTFDSLPSFIGVPSASKNKQPRKEVSSQNSSVQADKPITKSKVKELSISAFSNDGDLKGNKTILLETSGLNPIAITPWQISFVLLLFIISIIIPFIPASAKFKYSWSLILAFLFSLALIGLIWMGIRILPGFADDDVFLLGIGSIYKGSYDAGASREWLFSLTTPVSSLDNLGFGVPLWVVLLSVVGSSLYTLSILVSEILNRPDFQKLAKSSKDEMAIKEFRAKMENIVRHQFYMLFSPLGAMFIYQLLVLAKAVEQPVMVAIAALGSGLTLNLLLDKAVNITKRIMEEGVKQKTEEVKE